LVLFLVCTELVFCSCLFSLAFSLKAKQYQTFMQSFDDNAGRGKSLYIIWRLLYLF